MREIKACIFDMDGVICDTAKYHYLAWKALADRLGIAFTEEDNERLKGVSRMESLDILLSLGQKEYTAQEKEEFAKEKNKRYVEYITEMEADEILPGVPEFLKFCKETGIKVALGSVSKNAMTIINNLRLKDYFDSIVDGNRVAKAKPDPEVFLRGAMDVDVDPVNCVVFEDAQTGLLGAKAAGMAAVGIGRAEVLTAADLVMDGFGSSRPEEIMDRVTALFD